MHDSGLMFAEPLGVASAALAFNTRSRHDDADAGGRGAYGMQAKIIQSMHEDDRFITEWVYGEDLHPDEAARPVTTATTVGSRLFVEPALGGFFFAWPELQQASRDSKQKRKGPHG